MITDLKTFRWNIQSRNCLGRRLLKTHVEVTNCALETWSHQKGFQYSTCFYPAEKEEQVRQLLTYDSAVGNVLSNRALPTYDHVKSRALRNLFYFLEPPSNHEIHLLRTLYLSHGIFLNCDDRDNRNIYQLGLSIPATFYLQTSLSWKHVFLPSKFVKGYTVSLGCRGSTTPRLRISKLSFCACGFGDDLDGYRCLIMHSALHSDVNQKS